MMGLLDYDGANFANEIWLTCLPAQLACYVVARVAIFVGPMLARRWRKWDEARTERRLNSFMER
jgi:hypothetical protein